MRGFGVLIETSAFRRHSVSAAAGIGASLLVTWTERHWPEVQEAIIGVRFVLAASGALLLLASHPHGSEHLKDLLVGQILWVRPGALLPVALVDAVLLGIWFVRSEAIGRVGYYVLFACAVTLSVQLVGFYWCLRP